MVENSFISRVEVSGNSAAGNRRNEAGAENMLWVPKGKCIYNIVVEAGVCLMRLTC